MEITDVISLRIIFRKFLAPAAITVFRPIVIANNRFVPKLKASSRFSVAVRNEYSQ
jgi:hypothetical protein